MTELEVSQQLGVMYWNNFVHRLDLDDYDAVDDEIRSGILCS